LMIHGIEAIAVAGCNRELVLISQGGRFERRRVFMGDTGVGPPGRGA
jgi:hypothetical protein